MLTTRRSANPAGWVNPCYANIRGMTQQTPESREERSARIAEDIATALYGLACCLLIAAVLIWWWGT